MLLPDYLSCIELRQPNHAQLLGDDLAVGVELDPPPADALFRGPVDLAVVEFAIRAAAPRLDPRALGQIRQADRQVDNCELGIQEAFSCV